MEDKLTIEEFIAEEYKLKKRAKQINKRSDNLMIIVCSRLRPKKRVLCKVCGK